MIKVTPIGVGQQSQPGVGNRLLPSEEKTPLFTPQMNLQISNHLIISRDERVFPYRDFE